MNNILWKKHNYTTEIDMIKNTPIIEYDMQEAGYNLLKWKGYFTKDELEKAELMTKQERSEWIGKLQLSRAGLSKSLMECFVEARKLFFEMNDISDSEIISIKKDAIFIVRKCYNQQLNDYINFREKNTYIGYLKLNKKEFWYDPRRNTFDIKGFSKEVVEHHNNFLFKDLYDIFSKIINGYDSYIDDLIYLKHDFCAYELSKEYYKDISTGSYLINVLNGQLLEINDITDDMKTICFNNNNLNFILNMLHVLI